MENGFGSYTLFQATYKRIFSKNRNETPRKTYLYNFDPLKPHFYIVKLGFTGVCIIFLISAKK